MTTLRGAGLNPLSYWHHNDHLAPICHLLDIPLLLSDREWVELTRRYYPEVQVEYIAWENFTLQRLVQDFDVFFRSDLWKRDSFKAAIAPYERQFGKSIRTVHCPHGFSDKVFWLRQCADEDATLIYGPHMIDMLKDCGTWEQVQQPIVSGNYRLSYYKKFKDSLDAIVQDEVLSQFGSQQTTVLYAPTWKDEESPSTFFEAIDTIIEALPSRLNLLIKLHPMLEQNDIASLFRIQGAYEDLPNVVFLDKFPLIYPILFQMDAYLGDASAVGYDFLATNKPLFFLASDVQQLYLHRCGLVISPQEYKRAFELIEDYLDRGNDSYKEVRRTVYEYTFGESSALEDLKERITEALH